MAFIDMLSNTKNLSSLKNDSTVKKAEGLAGKISFNDTLEKHINPLKTGSKIETEKKLRDACIEMESLFVGKMLKEMRKTVHKTEWLNGGFAEEVFEDMLYDEYALEISKNSKLGLADMLYNEMSRKL